MLTFRNSMFALLAGLTTAATVCDAQSQPNPPIDGDTEVAVIGKEHITFGQLPDKVRADLAEIDRRYERQLRQLNLDYQRAKQALVESRSSNYMDNRLLHLEAQEQGISVDALIKQVKVPDVSDADVRAFYEQHQKQINRPFETAMTSITQHLIRQAADQSRQAYLDGLHAKYAAYVTLEPLREPVAATGPARGSQDAAVTIVEFADFQCPYCQEMAPVLKELLDKYPAAVRLVYRQMPLANVHPDAMHAAQASLCAAEQGRFWEMHDAMFADQSALSVDALKATAMRLHLKTQDFDSCLDSGRTAALVAADEQEGLRFGVNGTPGLFVNGRFFDGSIPYARLAGIVDDELRRRHATGTVATSSGSAPATQR